MSIGEVAARAGVRASALRYYEAEGLIPRAGRRGGRRMYDAPILERLALIELCKEAGFTIAEIRRLLSGFTRRTPPGARWRALAKSKLEEVEQRIAAAQRMKRVLQTLDGCECPTLEDCARALQQHRAAK